MKKPSLPTRTVRAGLETDTEHGAVVPPIYLSSTFTFAGLNERRRYDPGAFMCLSESIDLHRVTPESIGVPTTLVAVTEDQLVTVNEMRELESRLAGPRTLYEIHSLYGHDAFLKEREQLAPVFARALERGEP